MPQVIQRGGTVRSVRQGGVLPQDEYYHYHSMHARTALSSWDYHVMTRSPPHPSLS